jgi:IS605 OrfB family transposase
MNLTVKIKLQPSGDQRESLINTIRRVNLACNYISEIAWEKKIFHQYDLQKITYKDIRNKFELPSQHAIRSISKVSSSYKVNKTSMHRIKPAGAIALDDRNLSWKLDKSIISINTINGRLKIPFVCVDRQRKFLMLRRGESRLILCRKDLYLSVSCSVEGATPFSGVDILGVDMGIVNIATDSDGNIYSANSVNNIRHRQRRLRAKLQKKGTKSAKRLLKKISGKEARFAKNTNHVISKKIVALAKDTERDIAIEDLSGIRTRTTVRKPQRAQFTSWSFYQLRQFLTYKAKLNGVKLTAVDPRNTSRTCPACETIDKKNRPNQSTFKCVNCGFSGLADYIAALNIRGRAAVNPPIVSAMMLGTILPDSIGSS